MSLINTQLNRVLSVVAAVFLVGVLWQIYRVDLFSLEWRIAELLLAGTAFLASNNVFLRVPLSVERVFVTSDAEFAAIKPYPLKK